MPDSGLVIKHGDFAATIVNLGLGELSIGVVAVVVAQFCIAVDDFFAAKQLICRDESATKIDVAIAHVVFVELADKLQSQFGAAVTGELAAAMRCFGHFFLDACS